MRFVELANNLSDSAQLGKIILDADGDGVFHIERFSAAAKQEMKFD
jgi:hypothetical protein